SEQQQDEEHDGERDPRDRDGIGQLPGDGHQSRPVRPQASSSPSASTSGRPSYWAAIGSWAGGIGGTGGAAGAVGAAEAAGTSSPRSFAITCGSCSAVASTSRAFEPSEGP